MKVNHSIFSVSFIWFSDVQFSIGSLDLLAALSLTLLTDAIFCVAFVFDTFMLSIVLFVIGLISGRRQKRLPITLLIFFRGMSTWIRYFC